jgi:hypothetical protein
MPEYFSAKDFPIMQESKSWKFWLTTCISAMACFGTIWPFLKEAGGNVANVSDKLVQAAGVVLLVISVLYVWWTLRKSISAANYKIETYILISSIVHRYRMENSAIGTWQFPSPMFREEHLEKARLKEWDDIELYIVRNYPHMTPNEARRFMTMALGYSKIESVHEAGQE